jgi:hypothetical protein
MPLKIMWKFNFKLPFGNSQIEKHPRRRVSCREVNQPLKVMERLISHRDLSRTM